MRGRALSLAALAFLVGLCASGASLVSPASAQQLDAGKPPAQIFSSTCSACHRSPRGLVKNVSPGSLPGFLRQHYTTGNDMAGTMAAYVLGNGGTERVAEPPPKREPKQRAPETAARTPEAKEAPKSSRRERAAKKGKAEPAEAKDAPKPETPATEAKPAVAQPETPPAETSAPAAVATAPATEAKPAPREPRGIRLPGFPAPVDDDPPAAAPASAAVAPSSADVPTATAPSASGTEAPKEAATQPATPAQASVEPPKQTMPEPDAPKLDIMREEVHAPPRGRATQQKKRAE